MSDELRAFIRATAFQGLMLEHKERCNKHSQLERPGIVGINAVGEDFRCAWCDAKEEWLLGWPITVPNQEQGHEWICRVLLQGGEFMRKHIACAPDPKTAKRAILARTVTADGVTSMCDHITAGLAYTIHPHTVKMMKWGNLEQPGKWVERASVWAEHSEHGGMQQRGGWIPLELFDIVKESIQ